MKKKAPGITLFCSKVNNPIIEMEFMLKTAEADFNRFIYEASYFDRYIARELKKRLKRHDLVLLFALGDDILNEITNISALLKHEEYRYRVLIIFQDNYEHYKKQLLAESNRLNYEVSGIDKDKDDYYREIKHKIAGIACFLDLIENSFRISEEDLKKRNYKPALDFLNIKDTEELAEFLRILNLKDNAKKQQKALANFEQRYPDSIHSLNLNIKTAIQQKDFGKAKTGYEALLLKFPGNIHTMLEYADLLLRILNDAPAALKYYLQILKTDPANADVNYICSIILYYHLKDAKRARKHYRTAIRLDESLKDIPLESALKPGKKLLVDRLLVD